MNTKLSAIIFAALISYVPLASAFNIFDVLIPASRIEKVYVYGSGPIESIARAVFRSDSSDEERKNGATAWEKKREQEAAEMQSTFDELTNLYPEDQREQARITIRERFSDLVFDHPSVSERLEIIRAETTNKLASL